MSRTSLANIVIFAIEWITAYLFFQLADINPSSTQSVVYSLNRPLHMIRVGLFEVLQK